MADVDEFTPIPEAAPPADSVYVVTGVDRGDHLANWSPDEALPEIVTAGRTPLTLSEGIHWLLQQPAALERNKCFMTIGSRRRNEKNKLDARTPAIWISNGTGRDGATNRNAPKVGWCWAGTGTPGSGSPRRPTSPACLHGCLVRTVRLSEFIKSGVSSRVDGPAREAKGHGRFRQPDMRVTGPSGPARLWWLLPRLRSSVATLGLVSHRPVEADHACEGSDCAPARTS